MSAEGFCSGNWRCLQWESPAAGGAGVPRRTSRPSRRAPAARGTPVRRGRAVRPRPAGQRGRARPGPRAQGAGRAGQGGHSGSRVARAEAAGVRDSARREMRLRQGQLLTALCLGAAFPLLWFAAWPGSRGNDLDMYESQFLELRQRLLYAEKENKRRSHELSSALDEIKRIVARRANLTTNHTDDMKWKVLNLPRKLPMHLTNMHYYLPHLREYEDGIFPNVIFGQQRTGVSLVIGIPTVKREKKNYLISTLHSLLHGLSEEQKKDCIIIILIAEVNAEYVSRVAESVKTSFPREIQSGVLEVISPPASYYPDLSNLKKTFGDSEDRVRWRTKQNLDYSFLMLYAQPKGTLYLQFSCVYSCSRHSHKDITGFLGAEEKTAGAGILYGSCQDLTQTHLSWAT